MRKMSYGRSMKPVEASKILISLLLGFCIGVLTCVVVVSVYSTKQKLSLSYGVWVYPAEEFKNSSQISGRGLQKAGISSLRKNDVIMLQQNSSLSRDEAAAQARQLEEPQKETASKHGKVAESVSHSKTPSPINLSPKKEETTKTKQLPDAKFEPVKTPGKPICQLSNWRTDVCEMYGDVRIDAKSYSVVLVGHRRPHKSRRKNSWLIKPYARKFDKSAMQHIKEVSVRESRGLGDAPRCTVENQTAVPALVFAIGGYTGNYYHDFTDVLIPLFITARQFDGEVQFLISTRNFWWIDKYGSILKKLSRYDIVYLDTDDQVRCHRRVIVGLHSHKPMSIDPALAPRGYSMVDFAKLMRAAYGLERDSPTRAGGGGGGGGRRPRLLVIPRKGTRRFTNFEEIRRAAEDVGFEVAVGEAGMRTSVAEFARQVNSCDVMLGVHGAGLTNFVFLPANAVVIQVIPYGNLEKISRSCFMNSSKDAGLHYLDYSITMDESSLIERYPRDHPAFTDPMSIHRQGWKKMGEVYLDDQDVKLDIDRFRPVLAEAWEMLRQ